jgi:hypothetical protein
VMIPFVQLELAGNCNPDERASAVHVAVQSIVEAKECNTVVEDSHNSAARGDIVVADGVKMVWHFAVVEDVEEVAPMWKRSSPCRQSS